MTTDNESTSKSCRNCSASIAGYTFCPQCGQRTDTHILTFRELVEEFMDGLFNMDSRLWHSLVPLAVSPGKLTKDYLKGRRMHYLPPFRIYLILSVLFFLMPNNQVYYAGGENPAGEFEQQLEEELGPDMTADIRQRLEERQAQGDDPGAFCQQNDLTLSPFFKRLFTAACLKVVDDPEDFFESMAETLPISMIVTIPLAAMVMQLFYLFSGRRYVEHVVFLFHAHALFFLISIVMGLFSMLGQVVQALDGTMNFLRILAGFYIPLYALVALYRVYGGTRMSVLAKSVGILFGYMLCFGLVFAVGASVTILTG